VADVGSIEYGRMPYAGFTYVGDMEYGRIPFIYIPPTTELYEGLEVLDIIFPKDRYWKSDFPNLEDDAEGRVRPILYGEKSNIQPICIDTQAGTYEIANHALKEIVSIQAGNETLTSGIDYTEDLANGRFTLIETPKLSAGTTYYFVIEADNTIDGVNYLKLSRKPSGEYPDGQAFEIDGAGNWSAQTYDLCFKIWGRKDLSDSDTKLIDFPSNWSGWNRVGLRDTTSRTKIAQSFKLPSWASGDWFITAISVEYYQNGSPSGDIYIKILSSYSPSEVQVGARSYNLTGGIENAVGFQKSNFPLRSFGSSDLRVTAKGKYITDFGQPLINNIADIVEDVLTEEIGAPLSVLNSSAFSSLKSAMTEEIAIYFNTEIIFQDFLETAEIGQDWKLIAGLDRKLAPAWFDTTTPASGTLHLRDEDFKSFKMWRDLNAVKHICRLKFDHEPGGGNCSVVEEKNDFAYFFYSNEETMEFDVYLKDSTEASSIATKKLQRVQEPPIMVEFEVKGHCFDMLPMDRVYISRRRALSSTGNLDHELFRILKIDKNLEARTAVVTAVLDSQVSI